MHETSLSLLERLQVENDTPDWRRFTDLYEPLMRGWLRRRDVPQSDADDLVQNVLAVVVRRIADFEHNGRVGAFRTWLRTITVNCLRDYWRSHRGANVGIGGSDILEWIAQLEDPNSELTQIWDEEHDRVVMERLLSALESEFEPRTWAAFVRFAIDQVPAAKVAKELDMTPNAVFIAKSRVLSRLRQESAGLLDE